MMWIHLRMLFCIPLAGLLVACVTATPYQPAGSAGYGYQAQQIESNRYRVTFAGNSRTDIDRVRNYLLYRAAELTLAQGGDYFIVTNRNTERKVDQVTTNTGFGFGFGYPFSFGTVFVTDRDRSYRAYATITVHAGEKPVDNPRAFNAHEVQQNLQPTIMRPQ